MASEPVSTRSSLATCSRSYESKIRPNQLCVTPKCYPFPPVVGRNCLIMRSVTSRSQPLQDQASTTPVVPSRCTYFASSFPLSLLARAFSSCNTCLCLAAAPAHNGRHDARTGPSRRSSSPAPPNHIRTFSNRSPHRSSPPQTKTGR